MQRGLTPLCIGGTEIPVEQNKCAHAYEGIMLISILHESSQFPNVDKS
jgi:hypothetical protein